MIVYATEFVFPTRTSRDRVAAHNAAVFKGQPTPGPQNVIEVDDGGQSLIASAVYAQETDADGMFEVQLRSWCDNGNRDSHTLFNSLRGKRVRVTVEALD